MNRSLLHATLLSSLAVICLSVSSCGRVSMHVVKASWEREMTRQYVPIKQAAVREEAQRAERFAAAAPGAMLRVRIRGGTMDLGGRAAIKPMEVYFAKGETRNILVFHRRGPYQEAVRMGFSADGKTFVFDVGSDRPLKIPVEKGSTKSTTHENNRTSPQGVGFDLAVSV